MFESITYSISIMISEESGSISISHAGKLEHDLDLESFHKRLLSLLDLEDENDNGDETQSNSRKDNQKETDQLIQSKIGSKNFITNIIAWISGTLGGPVISFFKKNGFKVSNIGYIIYANGRLDEKEFNSKLNFDEHLYPLVCSTDWIDKIIQEIYECLNSENLPKSGGGWNGEGCEQCAYKKKLFDIFKAHTKN